MWLAFLLFTLLWQSLAQAVAAVSPNSTIASLIFSTLLSLCLVRGLTRAV